MKGTLPVLTTVTAFDAGQHTCAKCNELLDVHQPQSNDADRLLGTCSVCGSWFLFGLLGEDSDQAVQIALPDRDSMLKVAS